MKDHSIFALAIIALLVVTTAEAKYSGGTGEPNDPYIIETAEDLNNIGNHPEDFNKCFLMVADINLSGYTGTQFNIIGYYIDYYDNAPFTGVFDGNDHKVLNFTWTSNGIDYIGLFGCVGTGGQIKDLGLVNVDVNAGTGLYVGGLVGYNYASISNCYSTGRVIGNFSGGLVGLNIGPINNCYSTGNVSGAVDWTSVGGLVGANAYYGAITNCYSAGNVTGGWEVGGLVGRNDGTISKCYATGAVSGDYCYTGGLVGDNSSTITNCYSTGSVSGNNYVGGLVGYNVGYDYEGDYRSTITNCYSTGNVFGVGFVGGLVGKNGDYSVFWDPEVGWITVDDPGFIYNCYSTGSVTGSNRVGGLVGSYQGGEVGIRSGMSILVASQPVTAERQSRQWR